MLKSLTKENFWNKLFEKYPDLMKEFCLWIDAYKARVSWPDLIGSSIKYHDLPIEFQVGIFIQWTMERQSWENFMDGSYCDNMEQLASAIEDWFMAEQKAIDDDGEVDEKIQADMESSGLISTKDGVITVEKGSTLDRMLSASPKNRDFQERHVLYKTGDEGAPDAIKDRNGEVVLDMCKMCGRAEFELEERCIPRK